MEFAPRSKTTIARDLHRNNPDHPSFRTVGDWLEVLSSAEELKKRHVTCHCGSPIWIVGTAVCGSAMCFACITGNADCSEDIEVEGYHRQCFQ